MIASKVYIIAELGVNHNGLLNMALKLVDKAKAAGADAIKIQSYIPNKLVDSNANMTAYQRKNTNSKIAQIELLKKYALSHTEQKKIFDYCKKKKIDFISSPFDIESLFFIKKKIKINIVKIASGELTNSLLLLNAARNFKKIILSTGMSTLKEIEIAIKTICWGIKFKKAVPKSHKEIDSIEIDEFKIKSKVYLLHTISDYPAKIKDLNIRFIRTLKKKFGLTVGFSDHSREIVVPSIAVACGAKIIEKHITLNCNLDGPDHKASLNSSEFGCMVSEIRKCEKILGLEKKKITSSELKTKKLVSKSIFAKTSIKKGERFSLSNLETKRPGNGILAYRIWNLIGRISPKNFEKDEMIRIK